MKVLVIDDSMTMRKIIVKCLQGIGLKDVVQAGDGVEALRKFKEHPGIELILCDWNMPELNGYDFLIKFREDQNNKEIPFIMVTTEAEKESIVRAIQAGANNYILKPFDQETLQLKVNQTLTSLNKA